MPVTYPLDLSGVSSTNLVVNELHSCSEAKIRDYYFIVPDFAPFYIDNFKLELIDGSITKLLVEDVDYSFTIPYIAGTRHTGKQMYGGVTLHNLVATGILRMSYQTLGADQVVDKLYVLSYLADKVYNPRTTIWDVVTNVPNALPPTPHYQDYDDFKGQEEVVKKLSEIRDAILANSTVTASRIQAFLDEFLQGNSAVYVKKSGDGMIGPLTLQGDPTAPLHAATKSFVERTTINPDTLTAILEDYITDAILLANMESKLSLTGGVMTGPIKLTHDPIVAEDAARKGYVDTKMAELTAVVQTLHETINTLLAEGVSKLYVDNLASEILTKLNTVSLQRT